MHNTQILAFEILLKHLEQRLGGLVRQVVLRLKVLRELPRIVLIRYLNAHDGVGADLHINVKQLDWWLWFGLGEVPR